MTQDRRTFAANLPQHVIDRQLHAIVTDLVGTPMELVTTDGRKLPRGLSDGFLQRQLDEGALPRG